MRVPADTFKKVAVWAGSVVLALVVVCNATAYYHFIYAPKQAAIESVAEHLVSPDSAKFRNVYSNSDVVCGEVSGQNHFGVQLQYRKFHYSIYVETSQIGEIGGLFCDEEVDTKAFFTETKMMYAFLLDIYKGGGLYELFLVMLNGWELYRK